MRRYAAKIAIGLLAACFALLSYLYLTLPTCVPLARKNPDRRPSSNSRGASARRRRKPRRLQRWVRYEAISPNLKQAPCWWPKTMRSGSTTGWTWSSCERRSSGTGDTDASRAAARTITQQLAKNLYLSPSRNPLRKLSELLIARRLEAALTKRRIFELYLNEIEWGDGIYGAEAAAQRVFRQAGPRALARRGGPAGRRDHQSPPPQPRAPDRPAAAPPADDSAAHGPGLAARGRAGRARAAAASSAGGGR